MTEPFDHPGTKQCSHYRAAALRYLENARLLARRNEPEKAGEMLWGAVVVSAKALAVIHRLRLKGGAMTDFVVRVSKEIGCAELRAQFTMIQGLHGRFYEAAPDGIDIEYMMEQGRAFTAKVLELVEQKLRSGE